jgi:hypothetical protein
VRKVLRQNVMQIVADRDEVEIFVQELAHAVRAELEHA